MDKELILGCIVFGIILNLQVSHCITCFSCDGAEHIKDCFAGSSIKTCPPDEVCYMEKKLDVEHGRSQYYAGCRHKNLCVLDSCQKAVFGDGNSRAVLDLSLLPLCTECCYESNCNIELCGAKINEIPSNVTQCFNCPKMQDATACTDTIDCDLQLKNCLVMKNKDGTYKLECINKRQCGLLLEAEEVSNETRCCDKHLCNGNPLIPKLDKQSIIKNFTCPPNLARPTTTKLTQPTTTTTATTSATAATTTTPTTKPSTSAVATNAPYTASQTQTTPPTTPTTVTTTTTTTTATTPTTTPTTPTLPAVVASTAPPPKTLPPTVTTSCAVCAGPAFLCEKLFAPTPCPAPDNYCINSVINHKDGTRTVDRKCGDFDTCYREWFQGSSDDDKCRKFDENEEQRLDFQCTYCCVTDDCNTPLRPDAASLYKPA